MTTSESRPTRPDIADLATVLRRIARRRLQATALEARAEAADAALRHEVYRLHREVEMLQRTFLAVKDRLDVAKADLTLHEKALQSIS